MPSARRGTAKRWCELAIAGERGFVLERCELERAGPSYSLHTVHQLQQREPGARWFLLIGADQYNNLHTWRGWRELLSLVTLAVAERPGVVMRPDAQVAGAAAPGRAAAAAGHQRHRHSCTRGAW